MNWLNKFKKNISVINAKKKETEQRKKEDFVKQSDHRLTNQIEDMLHFLELSAAAAAAATTTTTKTREKKKKQKQSELSA